MFCIKDFYFNEFIIITGKKGMKVIKLHEDIGIKNIKSFFSNLKDLVINNESDIVLDFSNVTRIDLSLIQAIMSASHEIKKTGKHIICKSVSKSVKNQFQISGLIK